MCNKNNIVIVSMKKYKWSRNISLIGAFGALLGALIPWKNKDILGHILFGILSILFFITAHMRQKEINKLAKDLNIDQGNRKES